MSPDFRTGMWDSRQLTMWQAILRQQIRQLSGRINTGEVDSELIDALEGVAPADYWDLERSVLASAKADLRAVGERLQAPEKE